MSSIKSIMDIATTSDRATKYRAVSLTNTIEREALQLFNFTNNHTKVIRFSLHIIEILLLITCIFLPIIIPFFLYFIINNNTKYNYLLKLFKTIISEDNKSNYTTRDCLLTSFYPAEIPAYHNSKTMGDYIIGVDESGRWIMINEDSLFLHTQILGAAGSGKTFSEVSKLINNLANGTGLVVADFKGDVKLSYDIYYLIRYFGREEDYAMVYLKKKEGNLGHLQLFTPSNTLPIMKGSDEATIADYIKASIGDMGSNAHFAESGIEIVKILIEIAKEFLIKYDINIGLKDINDLIDSDNLFLLAHHPLISEPLRIELISKLNNIFSLTFNNVEDGKKYLSELLDYERKYGNYDNLSEEDLSNIDIPLMYTSRDFCKCLEKYIEIKNKRKHNSFKEYQQDKTNIVVSKGDPDSITQKFSLFTSSLKTGLSIYVKDFKDIFDDIDTEINMVDILKNRKFVCFHLTAMSSSVDNFKKIAGVFSNIIKMSVSNFLPSRIEGIASEVEFNGQASGYTQVLIDELGAIGEEAVHLAELATQGRSLGIFSSFSTQTKDGDEKSKPAIEKISSSTIIKIYYKIESGSLFEDISKDFVNELIINVGEKEGGGSQSEVKIGEKLLTIADFKSLKVGNFILIYKGLAIKGSTIGTIPYYDKKDFSFIIKRFIPKNKITLSENNNLLAETENLLKRVKNSIFSLEDFALMKEFNVGYEKNKKNEEEYLKLENTDIVKNKNMNEYIEKLILNSNVKDEKNNKNK